MIAYLRFFAHEHDDLPAFHATYIVCVLLSAALFNLGTFALLIVAHMALDYVKYRERHGCSLRATCEGMLRESLVDITLFSVALVFAVYLHHAVGVVSLSGLMHAEIGIVRAAATFVPKLSILHDFLKVMMHVHTYLQSVHSRHRSHWSGLDLLCFSFIGISVLLIAFSPLLMGVERFLVGQILAEELIPWKL